MQQKLKKQSLFSKIFPVPDYISLDPVGIDISLRSVRAIRLKHSKFGLIPDKYKEIVLKDKCELLEKKEDLEHCDELRNSLRELKKEMNLKYITLSLPELKTYVFNTTLPIEAAKTIDDALIIKLQENLPLDPSEIVYDYVIASVNNLKSTMEVVVTALPKNIIEVYTKLFKEEGLFPVAFESESQSVARAVVGEGDKTPYLVVNFGHAKISFAIVQNGVVYYTSSLPYSTDLILSDFSSQEAQILKSTLNKLLIYWFTNKHNPNSDEKITNLILTGSYASSPGLAVFLEQHLHVNVSVANVWKNCFDINDYVPDMDMQTSLQYNTAIGLTLMKKYNAYLLLKEEKEKIKKEYLSRYLTIFFFGGSLIFLLLSITLIPTYVILKIDQKALDRELSMAQDAQLNSDRQKLKQKLSDLQKTLNIVDTPSSEISFYLQKITERQPRDINLLNINFETVNKEKSIVLQGTSNSRGSLASFIDSLETVTEFKSVNLPFSSFARDTDIPFSITINLNQDSNEKQE